MRITTSFIKTLFLKAVVVIVLAALIVSLPVGFIISTGGSMGESTPQFVFFENMSEPSEGDVIIYDAEKYDAIWRHRIVNATSEGYITKGDANPITDQASLGNKTIPPVNRGAVHGTVLISFPFVFLIAFLLLCFAGLYGLTIQQSTVSDTQ